MSTTKFPNVETLGIEMHLVNETQYILGRKVTRPFVYLDDLECILEQAPAVYGYQDTVSGTFVWGGPPLTTEDDTHTARLVCVRPIERDTAADLCALAERVFDLSPRHSDRETFIKHARKLLDSGEEG